MDPIPQILAQTKTIAVVGLSGKEGRPGRYVPAYLQSHGYRIIPVNPNLATALGETAYPNLYAVPEPVDLVLIFQRSDQVPPLWPRLLRLGRGRCGCNRALCTKRPQLRPARPGWPW